MYDRNWLNGLIQAAVTGIVVAFIVGLIMGGIAVWLF